MNHISATFSPLESSQYWPCPSPVVPIILLLGTVVAFSIYAAFVRRVGRGVDPLAASSYVATGAACSFLAAAVVVGGRGLQGAAPSAYAAGVAMAVVGTAVAIAAFLAGLARVGSAWASIVSSFEPVFTVALGVAVLGDRLGPGKVAGGVAVVAGAVLLPLLGGAREPVGSPLHPEYTPTRGSTRR